MITTVLTVLAVLIRLLRIASGQVVPKNQDPTSPYVPAQDVFLGAGELKDGPHARPPTTLRFPPLLGCARGRLEDRA